MFRIQDIHHNTYYEEQQVSQQSYISRPLQVSRSWKPLRPHVGGYHLIDFTTNNNSGVLTGDLIKNRVRIDRPHDLVLEPRLSIQIKWAIKVPYYLYRASVSVPIIQLSVTWISGESKGQKVNGESEGGGGGKEGEASVHY